MYIPLALGALEHEVQRQSVGSMRAISICKRLSLVVGGSVKVEKDRNLVAGSIATH